MTNITLLFFKFDFSSVILFSGCVNGLIAIFLFKNRYKEDRRLHLGFTSLLVSLILILTERIFRFSGLIDVYPIVLFSTSPLFFLLPPLLYTYQRRVMNLRTKWLFHFIVPLFFFVLLIPSIFMEGEEKLSMFYNSNTDDPIWVITFVIIYILIYSSLIYQLNIAHTKALLYNYADPDIDYELLSNKVIFITSLLTLAIPFSFLFQYIPSENNYTNTPVKALYVIFSLSPHLILISLLRNDTIRSIDLKLNSGIVKVTEQDIGDVSVLKSELSAYMQTKKPYLNQSLTLQSLADELSWSRTQLSYIINNGFQKNFYTYINDFRINDICSQLHAGVHKKYSLEYIALDNGFKSYVSFYRTFKKKHNLSPKEYLKKRITE